jgi:hypothetical protein
MNRVKTYYVITESNKNNYFGQASASEFTHIKMRSANNYILNGTRIMKLGQNLA